jgi:hypothetical protein
MSLLPLSFEGAMKQAVAAASVDGNPIYIVKKSWGYGLTKESPNRTVPHFIIRAYPDGFWSCTSRRWDPVQCRDITQLECCALGRDTVKIIDEVTRGNK